MSDNPTLEALLQSSSSEDECEDSSLDEHEALDEREALDKREDNNTAAMSLAAPAAVLVHESSPYNLDLERILQDSGESCSNKLFSNKLFSMKDSQ